MSLFIFADDSTDDFVARKVESELPNYASPYYTIDQTWIPFRSVKKPDLTPIRTVEPVKNHMTPVRGIKPHPAFTRGYPQGAFIPTMPHPEGTVVQVPSGSLLKPGRNFSGVADWLSDLPWAAKSGPRTGFWDFIINPFGVFDYNPPAENLPTSRSLQLTQNLPHTPEDLAFRDKAAKKQAEDKQKKNPCTFFEKIDPKTGGCVPDYVKIGLAGLVAFAILMPKGKSATTQIFFPGGK